MKLLGEADGGEIPEAKERKEAVVKQACLFINASLLPLEINNATARQLVQNAMESDDWPSPLEINKEILSREAQRIGACLFFIGAADFLTQQYKLNDEDFFEVIFQVLRYFGLSEQNARLLVEGYSAMAQEPFGREALVEGGNTMKNWISGKDQNTPFRLFDLVKKWKDVRL